jgi:hypothetical protein
MLIKDQTILKKDSYQIKSNKYQLDLKLYKNNNHRIIQIEECMYFLI